MKKTYLMIIKSKLPNNGRTLLIIFIIVVLGFGAWAVWHFAFQNNDGQTTADSSQSIVPVKDSTADTVKVDTTKVAQ